MPTMRPFSPLGCGDDESRHIENDISTAGHERREHSLRFLKQALELVVVQQSAEVHTQALSVEISDSIEAKRTVP